MAIYMKTYFIKSQGYERDAEKKCDIVLGKHSMRKVMFIYTLSFVRTQLEYHIVLLPDVT